MTVPALARAVLARLVRPGTLGRWGGGLLLGLGIWVLLTLWWGQDVEAVGVGLVAAALVMGLIGTVSVLLASDVVRLALAAGATRRRVLEAWVLLALPVVVPVVALVLVAVSLVARSWGGIASDVVPLALVAVTSWFGGLGIVCGLASREPRIRRTATPGLFLLSLASVVGAGATAFDPVPGWAILAVALALTLTLGARLALRTALPPDVAGLLTGASTRKVAR